GGGSKATRISGARLLHRFVGLRQDFFLIFGLALDESVEDIQMGVIHHKTFRILVEKFFQRLDLLLRVFDPRRIHIRLLFGRYCALRGRRLRGGRRRWLGGCRGLLRLGSVRLLRGGGGERRHKDQDYEQASIFHR